MEVNINQLRYWIKLLSETINEKSKEEYKICIYCDSILKESETCYCSNDD